jgi:hypothetical protein
MTRIVDSPVGSVPPQPMPRRWSALPALALVAVSLLLAAPGASAGRMWCLSDPVVKIDGHVADVWLSSYVEMNQAATGPTQIVVTVPTGVAAELLAVDNGFGGHGYDIGFAESSKLKATATSIQVQVQVFAPATDGSLPLKVQFTPRSTGPLKAASASGFANAWVTLKTR